MLKRFISQVLVVALLWPHISWAMDKSDKDVGKVSFQRRSLVKLEPANEDLDISRVSKPDEEKKDPESLVDLSSLPLQSKPEATGELLKEEDEVKRKVHKPVSSTGSSDLDSPHKEDSLLRQAPPATLPIVISAASERKEEKEGKKEDKKADKKERRKDKEKREAKDDDEHFDQDVPEVGSLPPENGFAHGSWARYPHQPMVPIKSGGSGSIQQRDEEEGVDFLGELTFPLFSDSTPQRNKILKKYLQLDVFGKKTASLRGSVREMSEQVPLRVDFERGNSFLLSKAELIRKWAGQLMVKKSKKAVQVLRDWIEGFQEKYSGIPLVTALLQCIQEEEGALPNPYLRKLGRVIQQQRALGGVAVKEWLEHVGLLPPSDSKETMTTGVEALFKLVRKALVVETANQLIKSEFEDWDPRLKAFLSHYQTYDVEEKYRPRQWLLAFASILTSIGNSIAQGTIFASGMNVFFDKIGYKSEYDGSTAAANTVLVYTAVTAFIDNLPRNWEEFTRLGRAGTSKFASPISWSQMFVNGAKALLRKGSVMTSVALGVFYFFMIEYDGIKWLHAHPDYPNQEGEIKATWAYFGSLVLPLAICEFVAANQQLRDSDSFLFKKLRGSRNWLFHQIEDTNLNSRFTRWVLNQRPASTEEIKKKEFIKTLKKLRKANFLMDDDDILRADQEIFKPSIKRKKQSSHETLDASEAFTTISWFMNFLKDQVDEDEFETKPQSWKQYVTFGVGAFVVSTAVFACYKTLYYVMSYYASAMGLDDSTTHQVFSALGGVLSTIVISHIAQSSIEENINGLHTKKVHSRSSHPWGRFAVGFIVVLQGVIDALPYLVSGWLGMQDYSPVVQGLALTPFVVADAHSNAWQLKDTYGSYFHLYDRAQMKLCGSCNRGADCCCCSTVDYRRDRQVKWWDKLIRLAEEADPSVIDKLERQLETFRSETFDRPERKSSDASDEEGIEDDPRQELYEDDEYSE